MAPFLVNHPRLIHNWFEAKENAIATVKNLKTATQTEISKFKELVTRLKPHLKAWQSEHPIQIEKNLALEEDIEKLETKLENFSFSIGSPWKILCDWSEVELSIEGQEMLNPIEVKKHTYSLSPRKGVGGVPYAEKKYSVWRGSQRVQAAIKLGYTHIEGVIVNV